MIDEVSEYSGTCFHVVPEFLQGCAFFSDDKLFFVTNFHVCDDADNRTVFLRTAAMGKSMFTAKVEAVVPKLDIAILSITRGGEHEKWFLPESPETLPGRAKTSHALSQTHLKQNAENKHPWLSTGAGEPAFKRLARGARHRRRRNVTMQYLP